MWQNTTPFVPPLARRRRFTELTGLQATQQSDAVRKKIDEGDIDDAVREAFRDYSGKRLRPAPAVVTAADRQIAGVVAGRIEAHAASETRTLRKAVLGAPEPLPPERARALLRSPLAAVLSGEQIEALGLSPFGRASVSEVGKTQVRVHVKGRAPVTCEVSGKREVIVFHEQTGRERVVSVRSESMLGSLWFWAGGHVATLYAIAPSEAFSLLLTGRFSRPPIRAVVHNAPGIGPVSIAITAMPGVSPESVGATFARATRWAFGNHRGREPLTRRTMFDWVNEVRAAEGKVSWAELFERWNAKGPPKSRQRYPNQDAMERAYSRERRARRARSGSGA